MNKREIDCRVAIVMGWIPDPPNNPPPLWWDVALWHGPDGTACLRDDPDGIRFYSSDIAAAWQVVEWMCQHKFSVRLNTPLPISFGVSWRVEWWHETDYMNNDYVWADTTPLAICLAFLKAMDVVPGAGEVISG